VNPANNNNRANGFSVRCIKDSDSIISPFVNFYNWAMGITNANGSFKISQASTLGTNDKLVINSTGYVGIGTTTPTGLLNLASTANTRLTLTDSDSTTGKHWYFNSNSGNFSIGTTSDDLATDSTFLKFDGSGTAAKNTFIGFESGLNVTITSGGILNTALGYQALRALTSGNDNSAFGYQSLYNNTTGSNNTAMGYRSLYYNLSATSTTAIGAYAAQGSAAYSVASSTYVGYKSGFNVQTGSNNNTFFGYQSGLANTTGANNLLLGYNAGQALTTGSNNIVIGYNTDLPAVDTANTLNIGNLIYATGLSNFATPTATVGTGNVGIGTTTPISTLDINTASSTGGTNQSNPFSRLVEMTIGGVWYMIDSFDYYGHLITGGKIPTVSSCGTSPAITGNDRNFRVMEGSTAGSSCQIVFAYPYVNSPVCQVTQETGTAVNLLASSTPTGVLITGTGVLSADWFTVHCEGYR
jgi:hypothetical protein